MMHSFINKKLHITASSSEYVFVMHCVLR